MENIVYYHRYSNELISYVREECGIGNSKLEYNSEKKIFHSKVEKQFVTEFVLTKSVKSDAIDHIMNYLTNFQENNVLKIKRKIFIYNFQYINPKKIKTMEHVFKNYRDNFIFYITTDRILEIHYSFFLIKKVSNCDNCIDHHKKYEDYMRKDIHQILYQFFKSEKKSFEKMRNELYRVIINYYDIKHIFHSLYMNMLDMFPHHKKTIQIYYTECMSFHSRGNKDILYLERFILLVVREVKDNIPLLIEQ